MGNELDDSFDVGLTKLIGYLPIETISNHGFSYLDVMIELKKSGIETKYFDEEICSIRSGALFAFNANALSRILHENQEFLTQASWPTDAHGFIDYLVGHTAKPETKLFRLIQKVYGK